MTAKAYCAQLSIRELGPEVYEQMFRSDDSQQPMKAKDYSAQLNSVYVTLGPEVHKMFRSGGRSDEKPQC
ncbi:hypothetical protein TNCV_1179711 [Trichonephila clavipes]|nr:hypothetical protein TNCV_1179711 [Trichonephila clavipes]